MTFILQQYDHASFSLHNPNVVSPTLKHLRSLNVIALCLMAL